MNPVIISKNIESEWEILERKGNGHPDTLSDTLAEELSIAYSKYTSRNFGAILHHNFDKLALLGGSSQVKFGDSRMTSPVRVVINGRASKSFGGQQIPVRDILEDTVYSFFERKFKSLIQKKDIRILYEVSTSSTPGAVEGFTGNTPNPRHKWFDPMSIEDLPELRALNCNDTSAACYTAPNSVLSKYILAIESIIHSSPINYDGRIGTDIKVMGVKQGQKIGLTIAIPLMAQLIFSIEDFFETKKALHKYITEDFCKTNPSYDFDLTINPLDNEKTGDVYLTHSGSCIETGDEGVVGRGNRIGGLIRINRAMSMEGICGKNPVYHTGKVLAGAAFTIMSEKNLDQTQEATLYLVGQRGKSLENPWCVVLEAPDSYLQTNLKIIRENIGYTLANLNKISEKFINRDILLC